MHLRHWITALITSVVLAHSSPAHAAPLFEDFRTVNGLNSRTTQTSFGWDEIPYLYVKLSEAGAASIRSSWLSPLSKEYLRSKNLLASNTITEFWLTPVSWQDKRTAGEWTINGSLFESSASNAVLDSRTTSFVITPEPGSLILFGIGGIPLVAHILRRHRPA